MRTYITIAIALIFSLTAINTNVTLAKENKSKLDKKLKVVANAKTVEDLENFLQKNRNYTLSSKNGEFHNYLSFEQFWNFYGLLHELYRKMRDKKYDPEYYDNFLSLEEKMKFGNYRTHNNLINIVTYSEFSDLETFEEYIELFKNRIEKYKPLNQNEVVEKNSIFWKIKNEKEFIEKLRKYYNIIKTAHLIYSIHPTEVYMDNYGYYVFKYFLIGTSQVGVIKL